jgi:hypothetical protein
MQNIKLKFLWYFSGLVIGFIIGAGVMFLVCVYG